MRHTTTRWLSLAALIGALAMRGVSAQSRPPASTETAATVRVSIKGSVGVMYIHRPAFEYTRGSASSRTQVERETDGGGLVLGGGIEAIAERWWGGADMQVLIPVFDNSTSIITSAYGGRTIPHLLGGRVRIGMGPVLVRSTRTQRGLLAGLCFTDCTPVRYPSPLTTGGLGVLIATEWRPSHAIGIGLEGQLATGAQRFATGRIRMSIGS